MRFYLVPVVTTTNARGIFRTPKYFGDPDADITALSGLEGASYSVKDFGDEPYMLVALDATAGQHTALSGQGDVLAVPTPITDNVGAAALTTIKNALENANIPGNWVTTELTYKQVLRVVCNVFSLLQVFQGVGIRLFVGGITLSSTISQIPQATRDELTTVAQSQGLDTSGINGGTTLRAALKNLADQMPATILGGVTL